MNKYYTTLDVSDKGYIGTVFNANTNQPLYTTKPYPSQAQASYDINTYLATNKPPETPITQTPSQVITNTVTYRPAPTPTGRCCGR
jgi:hypothetical protein